MATKRPPIQQVGSGNTFLNAAFIAESGFGKSVLLGSAGKDMIILSIDPEGTDSAYYQGSDADEIVVRDFAGIQEAYIWLRDEGHREYKYVGVDSAPEAQKILQADWLEKNRNNAGKRHPDVLGIDGYQITQNQFIKMVKQFNDLPMHTIYTAKPQEFFDADGEVYYLPSIHGQKGDMARDFMGYMKVQGFGTYHTKKVRKADKSIEETQVRRWFFTPESGYKGKDRTDALGKYQDDITLPQMVSLVEKKAAATRPAASARKTPATKSRRRATSNS